MARQPAADPDLLPEYDFSGGERGRYAKRFVQGTNLVLLDDDVAAVFPDSESVNRALRALAEVARAAAGDGAPRPGEST